MFNELPLEILEIIISYITARDLYNLSKIDRRAAEILTKTYAWIVKMPKEIDWSLPNAPKKFVPYDSTDFTILYQKKVYTRKDCLKFYETTIDGERCLKSGSIILRKNYLVVDRGFPKITNSLQLGENKSEFGYNQLRRILAYWAPPIFPNQDRGPRGPVGIRAPRTRYRPPQPEKPWRTVENIKVKGKRYETDFSLEFETDPAVLDYSENDE